MEIIFSFFSSRVQQKYDLAIHCTTIELYFQFLAWQSFLPFPVTPPLPFRSSQTLPHLSDQPKSKHLLPLTLPLHNPSSPHPFPIDPSTTQIQNTSLQTYKKWWIVVAGVHTWHNGKGGRASEGLEVEVTRVGICWTMVVLPTLGLSVQSLRGLDLGKKMVQLGGGVVRRSCMTQSH